MRIITSTGGVVAPVLDAFPEELKEAALTMIGRIGEYFKYSIQCEK